MEWPWVVSKETKTPVFAHEEVWRLRLVRERFRRNPDFFTERELERLRFMRWLVRTGRLQAA